MERVTVPLPVICSTGENVSRQRRLTLHCAIVIDVRLSISGVMMPLASVMK